MDLTNLVTYDDAILRQNRKQQSLNTSLRFPLENQSEYPGQILFKAVREENTSLSRFAINSLNEARSFAESIENPTRAASESAIDRRIGTDAEIVSDLRGQDPSKQTKTGEKPGKTYPGQVSLYLPNTIQFTDGIEYSNVDLGARGGAVEAALGSGKGVGGVIAATLGGGFDLTSMRELFQTGLDTEAAQLLLNRTLGKVGDDVRGAIESSTGLTLNPNRRSLLRGVSLRRFRFTFKLIPTSEKESRAIKEIIKFFRTEMYPEEIPVGPVAVGYKFPSKFEITMIYRGKRVATGILPCFLENFDTNYNPNAMGMLRDGNFPEIDISMSFIEHRTLRRKDIESGY